MRWSLGLCAAVIAAVVALGLTASHRVSASDSSAPLTWRPFVDVHRARALLAGLTTVEPSPEIAYDRVVDFGPAWSDVDDNHCDTRNDILRRDLRSITARAGSNCVVASGRLNDPYTAKLVAFSRSDPGTVQIDHLIPLHAAWQLGAWRWTPARRLEFANDPAELLAVDGAANQAKGDSLADRWRPPNARVRCTYASNTIVVHASYGLGVTAAERNALASMLESCGHD